LPSLSVAVPFEKPFTITLTPGRDVPSCDEKTCPVIILSWAPAIKQKKKETLIRNKNLTMRIDLIDKMEMAFTFEMHLFFNKLF
jgi:hypothetical protein